MILSCLKTRFFLVLACIQTFIQQIQITRFILKVSQFSSHRQDNNWKYRTLLDDKSVHCPIPTCSCSESEQSCILTVDTRVEDSHWQELKSTNTCVLSMPWGSLSGWMIILKKGRTSVTASKGSDRPYRAKKDMANRNKSEPWFSQDSYSCQAFGHVMKRTKDNQKSKISWSCSRLPRQLSTSSCSP